METEDVEWKIEGRRVIYESAWLTLLLADVHLPSGRKLEHHVIHLPEKVAASVLYRPDAGVLLLWRHRFITGAWGWEIPAGRIDRGETAEDAACREAEEETGWRPGPLRSLVSLQPQNGLTDQEYHIFFARDPKYTGSAPDMDESELVEWVSISRLRQLLQDGAVVDGLSFCALLYALQFDFFGD